MLRDRLIEAIERDGPMPFERFMAACLYDPEGGFFATGPLRSAKQGDFLTSPEVSPHFGGTIARWVRGKLSSPDDDTARTIVEIGAGSGSLLRSLLDALDESPPAAVWAADGSPAARERLATTVPEATIVADLDSIPVVAHGVIIANELMDNLPCAIAVRSGTGWEERWVGVEGASLALVAADARPDVAAWADRYAGTVPEGGLVEVQLEAARWLESAIGKLQHGAVLVIDYGGTMEELEPRRTLGTLRTYRAHHLGPDPLTEPGETDVTVDVNFTALAATARSLGAVPTLLRQDDFLAAHGLRETIAQLRDTERAMAAHGDAMERLMVRSECTDAETLLHPRGLGDFRVLEVGVGEVGEPHRREGASDG